MLKNISPRELINQMSLRFLVKMCCPILSFDCSLFNVGEPSYFRRDPTDDRLLVLEVFLTIVLRRHIGHM